MLWPWDMSRDLDNSENFDDKKKMLTLQIIKMTDFVFELLP